MADTPEPERRRPDECEGRRLPEEEPQHERRAHERRWRDAAFFVVERRRGKAWQYGSMAVAIGLAAFAAYLLR